MYNTQYRMTCIFFDEVHIPMQLWKWIDQSYKLNQSINQITYILTTFYYQLEL